jgi:hypothetical protein
MLSVKYHSFLPNRNPALCCLLISHDGNNKSHTTTTTTSKSRPRLGGIQQRAGDSSDGVEKQKYGLELFKSKAEGSGIFFSEGRVCLYTSRTTQQPSAVRVPFLISLAKSRICLSLPAPGLQLRSDNSPFTAVGEVAAAVRGLPLTCPQGGTTIGGVNYAQNS